MRKSFKIEQENIRVYGHSGWGRYNFITKLGEIKGQTERQAVQMISNSIIRLYRKYMSDNDLDFYNTGVRIFIDIKEYKKKSNKKDERLICRTKGSKI